MDDSEHASPFAKFTYEQVLVFIIGLGFVVMSTAFSSLTLVYAAAGWMTALCDVLALVIIAVGLLRIDLPDRYRSYIFVVSLACVSVLMYMTSAAGPALPSDEIGFTAAAVQTASTGGNPYAIDYPAADPTIAQQPSGWFTHTFSGERVTRLAYPAGTFLILVPVAAAFGVNHLTEIYPLLLLVSAILGWLLVPHSVRPLVTALVLAMTASGGQTGSTDSVYMPFVILAAWGLPRFARSDVGTVRRLIGPIALGVACSMKQNAWVLAPFLVTGVAMEARALGRSWARTGAAYTGLVVATFLAINLPYIILDWRVWLRAVTLPFTLHTVLFGSGVAAIPLAGAAGGDHLELLSIAAGAAFVATLFFVVLKYRGARVVLVLLPVVALTLSTRSLSNYLYFLLIPALVAATTLGPLPTSPGLPARYYAIVRWAAVAGATAAAGIVAFVLLQHPPLDLTVASTQIDGSTWRGVTLSVTNHSSRAITPNFFAAESEVSDSKLTQRGGPPVLAAGATATYELQPLVGDHQIKIGDVVRFVALADQPESISQSDVYRLGVGPAGT